MRTFMISHPVVSYYVLTFAISWGGILLVIGGPAGLPGTPEQIARLMPFAIPLMLLGPCIAGLTLTAALHGTVGLRNLASRLAAWRINPVWYSVALLTAPLVYIVALLALSVISPVFLPAVLSTDNRLSFLLIGTAPGLLVGLMEEVGWTGFAVPNLRLRYRVMTTGLVVGILWGGWHLLTNDLWGGASGSGDVPVAAFLAINGLLMVLGQLPAFRILMVWVYERTGSLFVVVLMHASLVFSTFVLGPAGLSGAAALAYPLAVGVGMWLLVALIALHQRGWASRPSLQTRTAS